MAFKIVALSEDNYAVESNFSGDEWKYVTLVDSHEIANNLVNLRLDKISRKRTYDALTSGEVTPAVYIDLYDSTTQEWRVNSSTGFVGYYNEDDFEIITASTPINIRGGNKVFLADRLQDEDYLDAADINRIDYVHEEIGYDLNFGTYNTIE